MSVAIETVRVEGLKELEQKLLRDLPTATGYKVMRGAMIAAALPMMKHAKEHVRKDSGALAQSIGRFSKKGKAGDRVVSVFVGPKTADKKAIAIAQAAGKTQGKKRKGGVAKPIQGIYYGLFLELGTKKMKPKPYLRPAFISTKEAVVALFATKLASAIEKAGAKK